jgi:hypothetical protein
VLIDHTHKKWLVASTAIVAVATIVYVPYALRAPQGPKGGSALGLTYGVIGFAFMIFAGLLSFRKKVPVWRIGRAQSWMRGHLWLGLISYLIILYHGGLHFGAGLTNVMMWLFTIVIVSGVLGAALQHYMPRMILSQVPMETIYEQIGNVRQQVLEEADKLVAAAAPEITAAPAYATAGAPFEPIAREVETDEAGVAELGSFYSREVRPFLQHAGAGHFDMANASRAKGMFQQIRILLPASLHPTVEELENICEEKRQIERQVRMHRVLHGWLLLHIPLSFALLLLGAIHAVEALRY